MCCIVDLSLPTQLGISGVVEKNLERNLKWPHSPQCANRPLEFKPWASKSINTIGDLYNDKGHAQFFLSCFSPADEFKANTLFRSVPTCATIIC